ncbi:MAG TPA: fibronectin type III domain-containing protein, partial [Verrucomicrobiae bacterium]|nr:fibronectin type III domain-containing protein [Verrucomicrobiae bacterium]
ISNATATITSSVASLSVVMPQGMQTVFYDGFDTAASGNSWDVFEGSENGIPDYTVDWSFDYSSYFSVFNGTTIPPAPNTTNGTTRGVKLTVNNNDGIGATAGVSLYPKNQSFTGAYSLNFDLWINYPGGPSGSGSVGSTEHFTCGINHAGTRVNWASASPSDGIFFAMDGEGGTTSDYRAYVGNTGGSPTGLSFANSGFSASGASSAGNSDAGWLAIFPPPTYESPGAPGKRWVQVELSQDANNVVTWRMNGHIIAQRVNTSAFTNGNIMIGFMDLFASVASPAADAFVLFDNVRVEIPETISAPVITAQPVGTMVYPEGDAEFSVAATGSAPLTYQWRFNGANIPGATNNSYTRFNVQPEDAGHYSVLVANAGGSVISSNALLTLLDSPYVSGVQATPGSHSALISWNTMVPADSQVQFEAASVEMPSAAAVGSGQSSFGSSSYVEPALTTSHVVLLTGLQPGTRYSYQTLSRADTNTYVSGVYQFTTAGETVIDNPNATFTGEWTDATSSTDKYSTNYRFAASVGGAPTATATWRPPITTPGKYDVYVWYPQGANRASNAPFLISFNGGATNVLVNQQTGGGAWRLVVSGLEFAKGTNGFVRLGNNANGSVVIADAVRFVYAEAQDFPTTPAVPTWWRDFFFGGPVDPATDADGDGYTTAQEYVMGTVPTNGTSRLELDASGSNTTANVTFWPLHGNRTYQLLSRSELGLPIWESVSGTPTPTPQAQGVFVLNTTNAPQSFYRLRVLMDPNSGGAAVLSAPARALRPTQFIEEFCGPFRVYVR